MANPTLALIIAILEIGSLSPVHETLSLESVVSEVRGESVVIARLRNRGEKPCLVVIDDYLCQIETQLYDGNGTLLPADDGRALLGMRLPPEKLKTATLRPGETVEVMHFHQVPDYATATAGYLHWNLEDSAGQTLKVGFTYSLSVEYRAKAVTFGAGDALFGDWSSPKIEVPTVPLKQAQVNNVLSTRRVVRDARLIPMLIETLRGAKSEVVREYAAVSLGGLKATAAASSLAEHLRKDPERCVRICSARALGEIAAPETRAALEAAAREDEDYLVRSSSEDALAKLPR